MSCDYVLTYKGQKLATVEAKRAGIGAAEEWLKPKSTPSASKLVHLRQPMVSSGTR